MIDENLLKEKIAELFYKNINAKYADIAKVIDEQPIVSQWIPCSERLPENQPSYISGTDYYITLDKGVVRYAKYKEGKWLGRFGHVFSESEVIAWQEDITPEPYKKEV